MDVARIGVEALASIRTNVKMSVDVNNGELIGFNGAGAVVKADATATTPVKAVGIARTTLKTYLKNGEIVNDEGIIKAGGHTDLNRQAVIDVPIGTFTKAQIGAPVYLGTDGGYTLSAPDTAGSIVQVIGFVLGTGEILYNLDLGFASIKTVV